MIFVLIYLIIGCLHVLVNFKTIDEIVRGYLEEIIKTDPRWPLVSSNTANIVLNVSYTFGIISSILMWPKTLPTDICIYAKHFYRQAKMEIKYRRTLEQMRKRWNMSRKEFKQFMKEALEKKL